MHDVRQENLPFVGSSHEFVGAEQGGSGVSVFLFHGKAGGDWRAKKSENAGLPGQRRAAPPALRVLSTKHPALTRWAKVCRAYGASKKREPARSRRYKWRPG